MNSHEHFNDLLRRYADERCTPQERKALEKLILKYPRSGNWDWKNQRHKEQVKQKILQGILSKQNSKRRFYFRLTPWQWGMAASVLLVIISTLVTFPPLKNKNKQIIIQPMSFVPKDQVILKLSNGKEFYFDRDVLGITRTSEGFEIERLDENQLLTEEELKLSNHFKGFENLVVQNYLQVPNGRQFRISLLDGTTVWLNSGSSISFPEYFGKGMRKVSLQGEGYFKVAHDLSQRFTVSAKSTEIIVTGTEFNVSAYQQDTQVSTTLLEGSVNIQHGKERLRLYPGNQAITSTEYGGIVKKQVNTANVLSWHYGFFSFQGQSLVDIMHDVSKWYGVTVTIEDGIPLREIGGSFPISASLEELLDDLQALIKFHFVIKEKEVLIMP